MHHADRRPGRRHVRLGDRPEAAADGVEHRLRDHGRGQTLRQQRIEPAPGATARRGEHGLHGQGPQRQADVALADPVVEHLNHLEAAPAHVADQTGRPVEAGDHAESGEAGLLGAAEDPNLEAGGLGDRGDQRLAVRGLAHRLGSEHVGARYRHRVADRPEAPAGRDGARKALFAEPARLLEALAEAAERLLVETRKRRATELVINDEAHRVRADVDDGMMRAVPPLEPGGVEFERAQRVARCAPCPPAARRHPSPHRAGCPARGPRSKVIRARALAMTRIPGLAPHRPSLGSRCLRSGSRFRSRAATPISPLTRR